MRKIVLLFFVGVLFTSSSAFAGKSNLFDIDDNKINEVFQELEELEEYVFESKLSLAEVEATTDFSVNQISETYSPFQTNFSFESIDWGLFLWGFCCWPVGLLVMLMNEEKQTADHFISWGLGWLTAAVVGSVFWYGGVFRYY